MVSWHSWLNFLFVQGLTMSLESSANISSRFKQGHEFKNVLPLAWLEVSPLWQHRLYLANSPLLACTALCSGPGSAAPIARRWFPNRFNCCWAFFFLENKCSPGHLLLTFYPFDFNTFLLPSIQLKKSQNPIQSLRLQNETFLFSSSLWPFYFSFSLSFFSQSINLLYHKDRVEIPLEILKLSWAANNLHADQSSSARVLKGQRLLCAAQSLRGATVHFVLKLISIVYLIVSLVYLILSVLFHSLK